MHEYTHIPACSLEAPMELFTAAARAGHDPGAGRTRNVRGGVRAAAVRDDVLRLVTEGGSRSRKGPLDTARLVQRGDDDGVTQSQPCTSSMSMPPVLFGWRNATLWPPAPGLPL